VNFYLKILSGVSNWIADKIISIRRLHCSVFSRRKSNYIYLTLDEVILLNEKATRIRGLLRDKEGLESAIMRSQMASHYEKADIVRQAVLLVHGIYMIHAFIDGNKRTALLTYVTFLDINGFRLEVAQEEFAKEIERLVITGDLEHFTRWFRRHIQFL
jgi:death-on-curing protein